MNRQQILEMCEERDVELLLADGLDEAFLGYTDGCDHMPPRAIYSKELCIKTLMEQEGIEEIDAIEYLEDKTFFTWVGPQTPMFINTSEELYT
jgi:hypothetical protein